MPLFSLLERVLGVRLVDSLKKGTLSLERIALHVDNMIASKRELAGSCSSLYNHNLHFSLLILKTKLRKGKGRSMTPTLCKLLSR